MSIKECAYLNCENYTIDKVPNGKFTMFQFPRDPVRRKVWIEHGQVKVTNYEKLYMCSDHFDRSRYMSVNQRRTILVGAAVPYPVVQTNKDIKTEPNMNKCLLFGNDIYDLRHEHNKEHEKAQHTECIDEDDDSNDIMLNVEVGSTTDQKDDDIKQTDESDCCEVLRVYAGTEKLDEDDLCQIEAALLKVRRPISVSSDNSPIGKRRQIENSSENLHKRRALASGSGVSSSSTTSLGISRPSQGKHSSTTTETASDDGVSIAHQMKEICSANEFLEDDLISKDMTTFIFRNEQYIQMRRQDYIQEKITLLKKIRQYEEVLRRIKQNIALIEH